jgi:GDP-4-dehydro-6-deoxy-D-mannose reductase
VRVLVSGGTGFAGRWLIRELTSAGHAAIPTPDHQVLDITDARAVTRVVHAVSYDAIAHLAAIASRAVAQGDPSRAQAVNVRGTANVIAAAAAASPPIPILFTSTSEVYARVEPSFGPITELCAVEAGEDAYRRSKRDAEVLIEAAADGGLPVVITRAFNHTGPGQRAEFAVPAFAHRILVAKRRGEDEIVAGDVDVERDIGDVRDTVRAYRLLLEGLVGQSIQPRSVYNVATGRAVRLRDIIETMASFAGIKIRIRRDASLIRPDDPRRIVGDASALQRATGWTPRIPLDRTLQDVLEAARRSTL